MSVLAVPEIIVNARFLRQHPTGVQRYCCELTERLPEASLIAPAPPLDFYPGFTDRLRIKGPALPGHAWEQLILPTAVPSDALLWSPAGSGPIAVRNQVLTIHDVAHIEHPEWYGRGFSTWYRGLLPVLSKRVRRILTVSGYSKSRVVATLGVPPEDVLITPLGVDRRFAPAATADVDACLSRLGIERPYVLAVSAVSPRKNFGRLYEAWTRLGDACAGLTLVVVGKTGLTFSGSSAAVENAPANTRLLDHVPDETLVALYTGAEMFVYPSLYEGFGLPVLEAMACGAPVITSNVSALPETAGGAAILINPFDINEIAGAIRRLALSQTLQSELQAAGFGQAARFSWERTAELTREALQAVYATL